MQQVGLAITALTGIAIAFIGAAYLLRPRAMAATFGLSVLPHEEATSWLRIKGIRDVTAVPWLPPCS